MFFDNVTVFMYDDGTVCDPFDDDVYLFASFSPGGTIMEYGYVTAEQPERGPRIMARHGVDVMTLSEPINNVDDIRDALDHMV
jgi:hypothetical protein